MPVKPPSDPDAQIECEFQLEPEFQALADKAEADGWDGVVVALSVLLWTGCRIEDLTMLGRRNECVIDGVEAVRWQPLKKGSSEVSVPLLTPLKEASRTPTVQGATYVLGRGGKPRAHQGARRRDWCLCAAPRRQ